MKQIDFYVNLLKTAGYEVNMKELKQVTEQYKAGTRNVALFSRVSTDHQDLIQQTEEIKKEAIRCGFTEDQFIIIEHKESAVKLDIDERQGIQELKEAIDKHDIECVIVYEVSRISRRPNVLYAVRDYLIERGINLICIKPYMRLLDNDGKINHTANLIFSIFGSLAEQEGYIRKERMQRGVKHARSMGRHAGGQIMYGYTTTKDHYYIIKEDEATIVKRIFNEYVYGSKSMRTLARDLQEEGHFKGIKFLTCVQEIYNILHHDCYCGRKKGMPAIISESLYDKSVEKRKSSELKVNHTDNMALCKGILRDSTTGLLLSSNTAAKMYYSKRHSGIAVGMHIIEPVIWDYSVQLHKEYNTLDKEQLFQILTRRRQMNERKLSTLYANVEDTKSKIDKVEERLIMGKLSESKADELEKQLNDEINGYRQRIREIIDDNEEISREGNKLYESSNIDLDYENMDKEERYGIVHTVIDKAMLHRESRYILEVTIYNKVNDTIKTIKIDTYKKKIL